MHRIEKLDKKKGRLDYSWGGLEKTRQWPEVTLFCTLCESENTRTCENCTRNVHKRATKSDTLGHCLEKTAKVLEKINTIFSNHSNFKAPPDPSSTVIGRTEVRAAFGPQIGR